MPSRIADLGADLRVGVAAVDEVADRPEQVARKRLAPGDILDKARDQAVLFGQVGNDGRNLPLFERLKRASIRPLSAGPGCRRLRRRRPGCGSP